MKCKSDKMTVFHYVFIDNHNNVHTDKICIFSSKQQELLFYECYWGNTETKIINLI